VEVGLESPITYEDSVITAYRCHPFAVLSGGTTSGVIGELVSSVSTVLLAPKFPSAPASLLLRNTFERPSAMFALYGDGASNQGQVFEAFNLAKLWDLPWVFVCENNKYGMGTSAERSSSNTEYFTHGNKIPGIQANGMNVITSAQCDVLAERHQYLCGVEVEAPCVAKVVKLATTLPPDDNNIDNDDDGGDDGDDDDAITMAMMLMLTMTTTTTMALWRPFQSCTTFLSNIRYLLQI
jgi:Dehydrogenase E1 component